MNAGVNGAVIQPVGKAPVRSGRKKEETRTAFPELIAGLAAVHQVFGEEQRGQVNQGKQADGSLLNILGERTGRKEPEFPLRRGTPIPMGEKGIFFSFREGKGQAGAMTAAPAARFVDRGGQIAENDIGKSLKQEFVGGPVTGGQTEKAGLVDTGKPPGIPAAETAVKDSPVQESSPKAGLEMEVLVKDDPGGDKKAGKGDDGLIALSLREAYHLSGRGEPVKIKVAEPYYESKPEFAQTLSHNIATELSKGGSSLEIRLEPGELGSLLITLQTDKEGTHIELRCASEKTALLLDKNLAEIGTFLRTHTETPVTLQIRQEVQHQPLWNQNQGNSGGRNSRDGKEEKKRDDGIRDNEASDFIDKLRLGLEGL